MNTEDRELLELAARAGGIEACSADSGERFYYSGRDNPWNPLTDDGDALRLAVKLDISLRLDGDEMTGIAHWRRKGKTFRVVGNYVTGNFSEARMLIVRAAAEIGTTITAPSTPRDKH